MLVKFKEDFRSFMKGTEIHLTNPAILVGFCGCGKSTLIEVIAGKSGKKEATHKLEKGDGFPSKFHLFDAEKMNPRIVGTISEITVASMASSHGEAIGSIIKAIDKIEDPCTFIFDEPESGLSMQEQFKIVKTIKRALDKGHAIIAATHSPVIMAAFETVYGPHDGGFAECDADEWIDTELSHIENAYSLR